MKLSQALKLSAAFVVMASPYALAADSDYAMASIRLGSPLNKGFDAFTGLYAHRLILGEVLYEACNQKTLEVFTLTEEPWSRGRITQIWVRRAEDVGVCRDATGALPDTDRLAETSRHLRIGDPEDKVIRVYGEPTRHRAGGEAKYLIYELPPTATEPVVVNAVLAVAIRAGE